MTCTCNPSTQEVDRRVSSATQEIWGQPWIHETLYKAEELASGRTEIRSQAVWLWRQSCTEKRFLWEWVAGQCGQCTLLSLCFAWANLALTSVFPAGPRFTCPTLSKCSRGDAASLYQLPQADPMDICLCLSGDPRIDSTHFCGPFCCLSKKTLLHFKATAVFLLSPTSYCGFIEL